MSKKRGIVFIDIEGGKGSLEEHWFENLSSQRFDYNKHFLEFSGYSFVNYVWLPHPNKWERLSGKDMARLNRIKRTEGHVTFVVLCDNDGQVNKRTMKTEFQNIDDYFKNNRKFSFEYEIKILFYPELQKVEFLPVLMIDPKLVKGKLSLTRNESTDKLLKAIPSYKKGKPEWTKDKEVMKTISSYNKDSDDRKVFENMLTNLSYFGNYTTKIIQEQHGEMFVAIDFILKNKE